MPTRLNIIISWCFGFFATIAIWIIRGIFVPGFMPPYWVEEKGYRWAPLWWVILHLAIIIIVQIAAPLLIGQWFKKRWPYFSRGVIFTFALTVPLIVIWGWAAIALYVIPSPDPGSL